MQSKLHPAIGKLRRRLVLAAAVALPMMAAAQQIAFTWDDLPAHKTLPPGVTRMQVIQQIIDAMKQGGLPPAYGFVNGVRLQEDPDTAGVLEAWRAAGFPLGNHGWTHMNLNSHTAAAFEEDVVESEPLLQKLMGDQDWHWLRFPNLAEGDTPEKRNEVRAFLAARHYRIAAVSMGFGDFLWNDPYARCVAQGNQMEIQHLEKEYLDSAAADADYRSAVSKAAYGHQIPFVILMHVGAFDAHMLPRLIALYKSKGYSFTTLEQAERDPFYRVDVDLSLDTPQTAETKLAADAAKAIPKPPDTHWIANVCASVKR